MGNGHRCIWIAGIVAEGVWASTYLIGPFRQHTMLFLAAIGAAFAIFLWSLCRIRIDSHRKAWLVIGFAFLFRVTLLPAEPWQSEDVYRYIWDARVAAAGVSPFAYPADAPELARLRDSRIYPMINSKPYVTAYPPISQILFRASRSLFGENPVAMKATFSLLEFGGVLLVWRMLVLFGRGLTPLLLIAWNPFFVFEFSHSGHSDSGMIFSLLLALYLLRRGRKSWSVVSYAVAVLAKLHPALMGPLYVRVAGWKAAVAGIAAGAALILAYFDAFSAVRYLRSLSLYFKLFEFNASIHYFLRFLGRILFQQAWDKVTGPYLAVILVVFTLIIFWKFPVRHELALLHAGFWIMVADLCLATTVHPWYLSWAALALPFFPYAFMLYWTGAIFLSYIAYAFRPVFEPSWVLLLEYIPMYALMAWEIHRHRPLLSSLCADMEN
jgi:alpha-1,6-mannosyltransferase